MPHRPMSREQPWLLPPSLDEVVPADHPRALLSVWVYGFMTGVRSSRKLEAACREQLPYLWLTGCQTPDHMTLWRFYAAHRAGMRHLFTRTVRTAIAMHLVDWAVQTVDGTKVGANVAGARTYDAAGLRRMLGRVQAAIDDLEAQHAAGDAAATARLPQALAYRRTLRAQVRAAVSTLDRPAVSKLINLTDPDARLMKTRQGLRPAYAAQATVAPVARSGDGSGRPITAVAVVDAPCDAAQLRPMLAQAEAATGGLCCQPTGPQLPALPHPHAF
ncbi:MAG: transposase [Chloroflexota bacterium]|nr:transposase [Chloroflexota bacterium]MDE2920256.1 transposase [Chloroflexota bacterium]